MNKGFLYFEAVWYTAKELFTARRGELRVPFEGYLANKILAGKLSGSRLTTVLIYLLRVCSRDGDKQCLDILIYQHHQELPLETLANVTLTRLADHCKMNPYAEHKQVLAAVEDELRQRQVVH